MENEYAYKSDTLTRAEQKNIELLNERQSSVNFSVPKTSASPESGRKHEDLIKDIIERIVKEQAKDISLERLAEEAKREGIEESAFDYSLEKFRRKGEVYEHSNNRFRTT